MRHEGTDEEEAGIIAQLLVDVNEENALAYRDAIKQSMSSGCSSVAISIDATFSLNWPDVLGSDADKRVHRCHTNECTEVCPDTRQLSVPSYALYADLT